MRELNIQRRKAGSRNDAISQVKSAHVGLIMMLALNSIRPINEFRDDFLKAGNKANNAEPHELEEMWTKYARKLSELNNKQLLKHQRDDKLNLVGSTVERLETSLTSTLNLYEFSLDLEVRALVTMISKLSTFKSSFSIAELDDLEKITNASPKFLIAITAVDYLQAYNKFPDLVESQKADIA